MQQPLPVLVKTVPFRYKDNISAGGQRRGVLLYDAILVTFAKHLVGLLLQKK